MTVKQVYKLNTYRCVVHKGLRELPDVASRGMISPVAALMFSGAKRKKTSSGYFREK
jgi:hypothetical protein